MNRRDLRDSTTAGLQHGHDHAQALPHLGHLGGLAACFRACLRPACLTVVVTPRLVILLVIFGFDILMFLQ
jgi:hypothetical protein